MEEFLLTRYFEGKTTEEETKKVTSWLEESPEHTHMYHSLCRTYEASLWLANEKTKENVLAKGKQKSLWKQRSLEVLKIAAIVVLTVLISKPIFQRKVSEPIAMQTVIAPIGQHVQLKLADGTDVWLNAGSRLDFPTRFKKDVREVKLSGEGFFKVRSNTKRPFVVSTENYQIRALGTKFNVFAYKGTNIFETSLLNGKVQINRTADPTHKIELKPNECITQEKGKLKISTIKNKEYFDWRKGLFCFDARLSDVLKMLELYFDVHIQFKNKSKLPLNDICVGKFRMHDGLYHIMRVLRLSHNFNYKIDSDKNNILIY